MRDRGVRERWGWHGAERERSRGRGGGGGYVRAGRGLRFGCLMVLLSDIQTGKETFLVITFGL